MITESQLKDRIAALQERMAEAGGEIQESVEQESDAATVEVQNEVIEQETATAGDVDMWEGKTSFSQEPSVARIIQLSR